MITSTNTLLPFCRHSFTRNFYHFAGIVSIYNSYDKIHSFPINLCCLYIYIYIYIYIISLPLLFSCNLCIKFYDIIKIRAILRHYFKEVVHRIQKVEGNETISDCTVENWSKYFIDDDLSDEMKPNIGHFSIVHYDTLKNKVEENPNPST